MAYHTIGTAFHEAVMQSSGAPQRHLGWKAERVEVFNPERCQQNPQERQRGRSRQISGDITTQDPRVHWLKQAPRLPNYFAKIFADFQIPPKQGVSL